MSKTIETNMAEIGSLFTRLETANKQNDDLQLQLMSANSEISNLNSEIKIISIEKDSFLNLHDQKATELEKAKKESLSML